MLLHAFAGAVDLCTLSTPKGCIVISYIPTKNLGMHLWVYWPIDKLILLKRFKIKITTMWNILLKYLHIISLIFHCTFRGASMSLGSTLKGTSLCVQNKPFQNAFIHIYTQTGHPDITLCLNAHCWRYLLKPHVNVHLCSFLLLLFILMHSIFPIYLIQQLSSCFIHVFCWQTGLNQEIYSNSCQNLSCFYNKIFDL